MPAFSQHFFLLVLSVTKKEHAAARDRHEDQEIFAIRAQQYNKQEAKSRFRRAGPSRL